MAEHIVKKGVDLVYETPPEFAGHSAGYSGDTVVDEAGGAVQMVVRLAVRGVGWLSLCQSMFRSSDSSRRSLVGILAGAS